MKALKFLTIFCLISFSSFFAACGGGGGSSTDTGTVAMSITDAKPLLPENVSNLLVTFSEVWVHKPGEGWIQLNLVESPYTIDLLQFNDGNTTELVPPSKLSAGKYTQVRIVVESATMRSEIKDSEGNVTATEDRTLEIPSGNLKTDKNFTIDVGAESAMDIVIHFDLSMSVVVSGPPSNPTYSLKPVMHLFEGPLQAATIEGSIDADSFGASNKATVVVIAQSNEEEFTRLEVAKESDTDPTLFSIYWLVPNESYTVQIDLNHDTETIDNDCHETVNSNDLEPGETYDLNGGNHIDKDDVNGICI
jgi:hypothetical protein